MDFAKKKNGFKPIDSNHTTENICERIVTVVTEHDIHNCIIFITLDNSTINTKVIGQLDGLIISYIRGFLLHQHSVCHMINLIIKLGMKMIVEYINELESLDLTCL